MGHLCLLPDLSKENSQVSHFGSSPYSQGTCFKTPSRCLKLQTVLSPIYPLYFFLYIDMDDKM